jgi:hypothetical protein
MVEQIMFIDPFFPVIVIVGLIMLVIGIICFVLSRKKVKEIKSCTN